MKARLIASGGRLAQDFGFNRVAGEVLMCLYLSEGDVSLDGLEAELGLSKAAISQASAQLERLGLVVRVQKPGDRKRYYRSADDLGSALRNGLLKFSRAKLAALDVDLKDARRALGGGRRKGRRSFLQRRVERLNELNRRAGDLLDHPLMKLFSKLG